MKNKDLLTRYSEDRPSILTYFLIIFAIQITFFNSDCNASGDSEEPAAEANRAPASVPSPPPSNNNTTNTNSTTSTSNTSNTSNTSTASTNSVNKDDESGAMPKEDYTDKGPMGWFENVRASAKWNQETESAIDETIKNLDSQFFKKTQSSLTALKKDFKACHENHKSAMTYCMEETSPQLQNYMLMANGAAGLGSVASGAMGSCSKLATLAQGAQDAIAAYSLWCGINKKKCSTNCDDAKKDLADLEETFKADYSAVDLACQNSKSKVSPACLIQDKASPYVPKVQNIAAVELNKSGDDANRTSISSKSRNCDEDFKKNLINIGMAGAGLIAKITLQSQACKKNTNGSGTAPLNLNSKVDVKPDCQLPANQQNPVCLCLTNKDLLACDTSQKRVADPATFSATNSFNGPRSELGTGNLGTDSLDLGGVGTDGGNSFKKNGGTDGGFAGPPLGGSSGGGGGGSSGGGSGSDSNGPQARGSSLNTKITGGFDGGGGGGGGFGGRSPGADRSGSSADMLRKQFGPGSNHSKNMAAYENGRKQVGFSIGQGLFDRVTGAHKRIYHTMSKVNE